MMRPSPKPSRGHPRRIELAEKALRNLRDSFVRHRHRHPDMEIRLHRTVLETALGAEHVDWRRVNPSIQRLTACRDSLRTYLRRRRRVHESVRGITDFGSRLDPEATKKIRAELDALNDVLRKVRAHKRNLDKG